MTDHLSSVRIISRQEQLGESLRVLLTSMSRVASIQVARDVSSCVTQKEDAPPSLVLLALDSSDAESETLLALHQVKSTWPGARTAVLVQDEAQYRVAQTAGVDVIVFEGIIAGHLLGQIDRLLASADR